MAAPPSAETPASATQTLTSTTQDKPVRPSASAAANRSLFPTDRTDLWWFKPAAAALFLAGFGLYVMWAVIPRASWAYSAYDPYISPFYSPELDLGFWPDFLSPAFILLWAPIGFRATCYYARRVYYRAFMAHPPACAVGEMYRTKFFDQYHGEQRWPWVLQNLHRYFLYLAILLALFHWHDAWRALQFEEGWGVGLGTLVIGADALLLSLYILSCHSLRHLVGGKIDCLACHKAGETRHWLWKVLSRLNRHHDRFFWLSLFMVGFADFYVRMLARGVFTDWRLI